MKTIYKLITIVFAIALSSLVNASSQTDNGNISFADNQWMYDNERDEYYYLQELTVTPNKPIKFNYTIHTFDYLNIYTIDSNGYYKRYVLSTSMEPCSGSVTVISSTSKIYISLNWGWESMNTGQTVLNLTYQPDTEYTIYTNPSIINNDQYIAGKLGIGVQPTEKFEVNGNVRINNRLSIGGPNTANYNLFVSNDNNSSVNTSIYNTIYKNSTSTVYGIRSYATNYSGNTYGIYSSVGGATGKKWAGYFNGGDLEIVDGNLFLNSENSVISTKDDNLGIVKKYGQTPVWAVGSSYSHRFGKWSTPTLKGNISTGTFTEQMRIDNNGKVGIGTNAPAADLQIGNSISDIGTPKMRIVVANGATGSVVDAIHIDNNDGGNFDKGTAISIGTMSSIYGEYTSRIVHFGNTGQTRASKLQLQTHSASHGIWNTGILIDQEGKVGIGTTKPSDLLSVNGIIRAKEVKIDLCEDLADYVFSPDYTLMPLHKVEAFVKTNKHLPEIPSAAEVKEKGLSMGEMQNKLLQKIEELTLYVIEQQKRIEQLEKNQK